jgi:hypothetical protein
VTLSIDADKGDALVGDHGFLSPDGSYSAPITGLEIRADLLAWELARVSLDSCRESLDAYVLDADSEVADACYPDISEF